MSLKTPYHIATNSMHYISKIKLSTNLAMIPATLFIGWVIILAMYFRTSRKPANVNVLPEGLAIILPAKLTCYTEHNAAYIN